MLTSKCEGMFKNHGLFLNAYGMFLNECTKQSKKQNDKEKAACDVMKSCKHVHDGNTNNEKEMKILSTRRFL